MFVFLAMFIGVLTVVPLILFHLGNQFKHNDGQFVTVTQQRSCDSHYFLMRHLQPRFAGIRPYLVWNRDIFYHTSKIASSSLGNRVKNDKS